MRLAVLSDVHSNRPALEAVLADVDRVAPEGIWVAGDLVGYNPWPNEVLEILRARKVRAIRGNHDRAALGGEVFAFNELASTAFAPPYRRDSSPCTTGALGTTTSTSSPGPRTSGSSGWRALRSSSSGTRTSR